MGLVSKPYTFSAGASIIASEHNSNFDTLYSCINGSISNANISTSAAIAYSKLALTGSILNSDINASAAIVDSKLAQITTASKVSGAAITALASVPSGAGVLPIANIATGTADGTKFVRDDGTLVVPQTVVDYAAGDFLLSSSDSTLSITDGSYTKRKSIKIPREGTLRIKFTLGNVSGSGGTSVFGRIYKNGVAVGTERDVVVGGSPTEFSEDISGWSEQDEVQIYCKVSATSGDVSNFRVYSNNVSNETVVYNT